MHQKKEKLKGFSELTPPSKIVKNANEYTLFQINQKLFDLKTSHEKRQQKQRTTKISQGTDG